MQSDFYLKVLRFFAENDVHHDLYWYVNDKNEVSFSLNCNDLFWWACADGEELTEDNFDLFLSTVKIVENVLKGTKKDHTYLILNEAIPLFCCRVRKMRPQGCCYPENRNLWPLYDACGPEREVQFGNPYKPGQRQELIEKNKKEAERPINKLKTYLKNVKKAILNK